jgi:hypothetical protein
MPLRVAARTAVGAGTKYDDTDLVVYTRFVITPVIAAAAAAAAAAATAMVLL